MQRFEEWLELLLAGQLQAKTVAICLQQMGMMLDSGVSIAETFMALERQNEHPKLRRVLEDINEKVTRTGWKLSGALAEHPDVFPVYAVMLARAGETGGNLAGRLTRAGELMERDANLAKQIKTALTGPMMTMLFGGGVAFGVVKFVMPKFLGLYANMGVELPLLSKLVIGFVNFVNHPAFLVALVGGGFVLYKARHRLAEWLFNKALTMPKVSGWLGIMLCAQLCDILASLVKEGVPILQALQMIANTTQRRVHRENLDRVCNELRTEGSLSEAFLQIPYFPVMFHSVCTVAEETGGLDDMLRSVNRLLEQEVDVVVSSVVNLVEPVTVSVLGAFMAVMFVGMFLPIYGLLTNLG